MADFWYALQRFFDAGGPVLWLIFIVAVIMWTLIIERYWYQWLVFPRDFAALCSRWRATTHPDHQLADMRLRRDVCRLRLRLNESLPLIRTLIVACPLLGLLGTVTGMIQVFAVLELSGTGNPRAMAAGVSMATIPTMSGLVVALSGYVFSVRLQRDCTSKVRWAGDELYRKLHECRVRQLKAYPLPFPSGTDISTLTGKS
ncbi:MAG: MotA/TolQ/ExbB proton channel family protein [Desulfobulbaceae bacterium]|nr:MAG: MotA/TolQ/ExbB proton channel family protein [Desulfobulbaceae bacterium]